MITKEEFVRYMLYLQELRRLQRAKRKEQMYMAYVCDPEVNKRRMRGAPVKRSEGVKRRGR